MENAELIFHGDALRNTNHLPEFIGKDATIYSRPIKIDPSQRELIWNAYLRNPVLSSAVDKFLQYVTMSGMSIHISMNGKVYDISVEDKKTKEYMTRDLQPQLEIVLRDWILYGYTRVKMIESSMDHGYPSFVVLEEGLTYETFHLTEDFRRKYSIMWNQAGADRGNAHERVVENGYIFLMDEPDIKGNLTSAVALSLRSVQFGNRLWNYYMKSAYNRCSPPYVFGSEGKDNMDLALGGPLAVGVASAEAALDGSIGSGIRAMNFKDMQQKRQYVEAIGMVHDMQDRIAERDNPTTREPARSATAKAQAERKEQKELSIHPELVKTESELPWQRGMLAPQGTKLQTSQQFAAPENMFEIETALALSVASKIGIPGEMLSNKSDKHAANVDAMHHQLRTNVHYFQQKCKALLESMLLQMWAPFFDQIVDEEIGFEEPQYGESYADAEREESEDSEEEETKKRYRQYYGSGSDREISRDERMQNYEMEYSSNDEWHEKRNANLEKRRKMRDSVEVKVTFIHNPSIIPYELLVSYYEQGIITKEAFQDFAVSSAGMPQDAKEPDMEAAVLRRAKAMAEATTVLKPDAAGGASKAKKRKAQSSTSASTSSKTKSASSKQSQKKATQQPKKTAGGKSRATVGTPTPASKKNKRK